MKRIGLRAWAALALAAWPAAVPAQEAAPSAPAAQSGWQVDWGDNYCTLIPRSGGEQSRAFALRRVPGSGPVELVTLEPQGGQAQRQRNVRILLAPSGEVEGVVTRTFDGAGGRAGNEVLGDGDLLELFAASTGIEVRDGTRRLFQMSYPPARDAVAALRTCEADALREWGVDPAALAAQRTPPRIRPSTFMNFSDYPREALRRREHGTVVMRLIVDPEGRVTECAVAVSSGSLLLDRQSCAVALQRTRFWPARGADGEPVRGIYVHRIRWELPDDL